MRHLSNEECLSNYRSASVRTSVEHINAHIDDFCFHFANTRKHVWMKRIGQGRQTVHVREQFVRFTVVVINSSG